MKLHKYTCRKMSMQKCKRVCKENKCMYPYICIYIYIYIHVYIYIYIKYMQKCMQKNIYVNV